MEHARPLEEDFTRAMYAERAAWLAVANRLPGSPEFDAALWQRWVAAAHKLMIQPSNRATGPGATLR